MSKSKLWRRFTGGRFYTVTAALTATLKSRVAFGVALLFGAVSLLLLVFQLQETRNAMSELLRAQQASLVQITANEIDEKFAARREALRVVARRLSAQIGGTPQEAGRHLTAYPTLLGMFDSVHILSGTGEVIASTMDGAMGINVANRNYFRDTLQGGRGVISEPYANRVNGAPTVSITAPVLGPDGRIVAVLAGSIALLQPNFLGRIGTTPLGRTGYLYIVARGEVPVTVSHPNRKQILQPIRDAGQDRPIGRALNGFEGTMEGINSSGTRGLMSFRHLRETGWVLGAMLPADEAFAPIRDSQEKTLFAGLIGVLAVALATFALVHQAMAPLDALRRHVRRRLGNPDLPPLPVRGHDEVGQLTDDFNRLMAAQREAERALAEGETRLRTITDNVPVLIGYVDRDLRYRFNNHTYQEWFGIKPEAIAGRSMRELTGEAHFTAAWPDIQQALAGYSVTGERELDINGRMRVVEVTYMPHYGLAQEVLGLYILKTDITERRRAQQRLEHLAAHDVLTGLVNRGAFTERLRQGVLRMGRSGKPLAVMYLDVDRFKIINDTHGHGIGDRLLRDFAARLTGAVRKTDVVGRLGGDEFVILAEDLGSGRDALLVAQKIVEAMREPFIFDGLVVYATTSVGLTFCEPDEGGIDGSALLERADRALYEAKTAGRNTFRVLEQAD